MRTTSTVVVGLALVATLVGCGGSGSAKKPSDTTSSVPARAGGTATAQFCALTAGFSNRVTGLSQGLSADPTRIRRFVDALVAVAKQAAEAAPPQISADAQALTAAATDYAHDLESAGYDVTKLSPDAAARLTRPDVADASRRVQDYAAANCRSRA